MEKQLVKAVCVTSDNLAHMLTRAPNTLEWLQLLVTVQWENNRSVSLLRMLVSVLNSDSTFYLFMQLNIFERKKYFYGVCPVQFCLFVPCCRNMCFFCFCLCTFEY